MPCIALYVEKLHAGKTTLVTEVATFLHLCLWNVAKTAISNTM